jgi:ActR/RegA family two-component response regulator
MTVRKPPSPAVPAPEKLRILLVQADAEGASDGLRRALERKGHEVVVKTTITESLACVTAERFAALICDLHLPAAGDGFTLVNAMHHCHPQAVTMVMSNYPALKESLATLLPQADEVLVTPVPNQQIVELLEARLRVPKQHRVRSRESIATILERYGEETVSEWLKRTKDTKTLRAAAVLPDEDRTGYLKALLRELVYRLRAPRHEEGTAAISNAAIAHGRVRKQQGYTSAMLVEESRILQVCIFQTLRNNLNAVDLALVLTDVMTIADEVDSQLRQTMDSFSQISSASRAS